MTYRNNSGSSAEVENLLKDVKEIKIRVDDVYTKSEIQDMLAEDALNDAENFFNKETTMMLLDGKASVSSLTTTNTNVTNLTNNLSTNYYNKTSTDTLINVGACEGNLCSILSCMFLS